MVREVDRLLAQLATAGRPGPEPRSGSGPQRRITRVSAAPAVSRAAQAGLWARVTLGTTLGCLITQWPYANDCGAPLAGYLGAVTMVMVAGTWSAAVSWRQRNAPAHVLSLLLLLWGITLAAGQVLPRTGYAAVRALWGCS